MQNTTPHKYAEVIKAFADGKTIQFSSTTGGWIDFRSEHDLYHSVGPWDETHCEWRIKPDSKWYRVAEFNAGGAYWLDVVCSKATEESTENEAHFARWVSEKVEYV